MVMFLFLRSFSATIIPSFAVPVSLIGTFGVMYLLGYSLNNLSLMALTISTGFVVDDAIVMIENIARYIEEGETPLQAALKGPEQIGFTIISLTISLIAVLIPLLFMGDIVGRLFREFAVTLAVTILVSAVVSLTLTPMMCARVEATYDATVAGYRQTVLTAFQQVEDSLAALRILASEAEVQSRAVKSAQQSLEISAVQYKGGIASYLQVITAQTVALQNQRTEVELLTRRMVATVNLIQALGGGWDSSQMPAGKALYSYNK